MGSCFCVLNQTEGRKLFNQKVPRSWSIQMLLFADTHMTTTQNLEDLLLFVWIFLPDLSIEFVLFCRELCSSSITPIIMLISCYDNTRVK